MDKIKKKRKSSIKSRYYVNNSNSMVITKTTGMASEIIKEVHEDEEHSNHSQ